MRGRNQKASMVVAALAATLGVSACQSNAPTEDQMSRTTLETAPAELQLMCANAAAAQSGTESSKVLPVSSRKVDSNNYVVDLNANGKPMSCNVDATGTTVSVNPA
ncbi:MULTISPECIES: hypothetical protein [Mesorhizobium]|uniref:Secreted protein n=1 Tax=Mesorhizobium denitrificans TaxID=2294114 RepID=A0A371XJF5_9HYPH|nr:MULTISPECIES: hypothetical protein [Mesorhizobium]RFC69355.1 hypothetical protein DY251_01005 [Mesorhizobium denitrificans]